MNTEAQRARNKRKRDKLREKRRLAKGDSILRFRLNGYAQTFAYPCGLLLRSQWTKENMNKFNYSIPWCRRYQKQVTAEGANEWHSTEWSTEWVYMTTHDFSSSAHDAVCAFINTAREFHDCEFDYCELIVQLNGRTRRYVWRGHTCGLKAVIRRVSACARTL